MFHFGYSNRKFIDERFGAVEARLGAIDKRFDKVDQRLSAITEVAQENFDAVTKDLKNLDDAINNLDLKWDEKFIEFKAGLG